MATFMFIYRGGAESYKTMTPDQMQKAMQKWNDWITEGFRKGWMLDAGDALTQEVRMVNSKKVISDGPFVEAKEIVGGYSLVKADSIDAAAELAKGCPGLESGGLVEVRVLAGLAPKG